MTHHAALPRLAREARRKEAGRLFCRGVSQAEVARRFGVSTAAACIWHAAWKADGMKGLASKGPPGFPSALDGKARKRFKAAILKGPLSHGYPTDLWTLQRLAEVLKKETGVSFGPVRTWQVVREMGFTPQKPRVRAKERDERAIKRWKTRTLPGLKKWAARHGFLLGFEDESGISDKPVVRRTWAPKGQTPTIAASGSWKSLTMAGVLAFTPRGRRANLYLRLQPGALGRHDFVRPLKDIKHELRGRKLLLIWDGLPAHTAKVVREYIAAQSSWPRVERYPGYAPELSPVEFLWSPLKTKDLAHLPPRGLDALKRRVRKAWCRIRKDKALLAGCLRKAGVLT